jgi:hypothetical protein
MGCILDDCKSAKLLAHYLEIVGQSIREKSTLPISAPPEIDFFESSINVVFFLEQVVSEMLSNPREDMNWGAAARLAAHLGNLELLKHSLAQELRLLREDGQDETPYLSDLKQTLRRKGVTADLNDIEVT